MSRERDFRMKGREWTLDSELTVQEIEEENDWKNYRGRSKRERKGWQRNRCVNGKQFILSRSERHWLTHVVFLVILSLFTSLSLRLIIHRLVLLYFFPLFFFFLLLHLSWNWLLTWIFSKRWWWGSRGESVNHARNWMRRKIPQASSLLLLLPFLLSIDIINLRSLPFFFFFSRVLFIPFLSFESCIWLLCVVYVVVSVVVSCLLLSCVVKKESSFVSLLSFSLSLSLGFPDMRSCLITLLLMIIVLPERTCLLFKS